jgi:hypothetical protein
MAVFCSCLTVTSCITIPAQITHDPATKVSKSSPDKKQALSYTRTGDRPTYPRDPTTIGIGVLKPRRFLGYHLELVCGLRNWRLVVAKSFVVVLKSLSSSNTFASRVAFSRAAT